MRTFGAAQPARSKAIGALKSDRSACRPRAAAPSNDGGDNSAMATPAEAAAASRRALLLGVGGAALLQGLGRPQPAAAASGLGRYIKRKALDPLETYVPLVLQAQEQLLALKGTVAADPAGAREALRSGAFRALRDNVRAIGEYAAQGGGALSAQDAGALVSGFFRRLEDFDLLLYRAVKDGSPVDGPEAEARLEAASAAMAALISTVPADVLARARAVLDGAGAGTAPRQQQPQPQQQQEQSLEDVELLNELLTIWE